MTIRTASVVALVASLGLALPVWAQTDDQQTPPAAQSEPSQAAPEQTEPAAAPTPPATAPSEEQSATSEAPADPMAAQIAMQEEGTTLGTELIGATVNNADGDAIGEINDLIFAEDGRLQGVVLGVGGLLGLGQKLVGFKIDQLQKVTTDQGTSYVLNVTADQLDAAQAFKSLRTQQREAEAERARQQQETKSPNPAAPAGDGQAQ